MSCQTFVMPSVAEMNRRHCCCYRLEKKDDGTIDFYYRGTDGEVKSMNCGLVLFGTGRKPIVHNMGLEVSTMLIVALASSSLLCMQTCTPAMISVCIACGHACLSAGSSYMHPLLLLSRNQLRNKGNALAFCFASSQFVAWQCVINCQAH